MKKLALAFVALALVIAACGGSGGDGVVSLEDDTAADPLAAGEEVAGGGGGLLEKSHVFTCFHNHRTGTGAGALSPSLNSSLEWDSAAILRVYHNRRAPPFPAALPDCIPTAACHSSHRVRRHGSRRLK